MGHGTFNGVETILQRFHFTVDTQEIRSYLSIVETTTFVFQTSGLTWPSELFLTTKELIFRA